MSDIPKGRVGPGSAPGIATGDGSPLDAELSRVLTDIKQTISKAELLARMDWQQFSPEQLQAIQDTILELLAGQLPPETLAQLEAGTIDSETLQKLLEYLVKSGASPLEEASEDLATTGLAEQEGDSFLEPGEAAPGDRLKKGDRDGVRGLERALEGEPEGALSDTLLDRAIKSASERAEGSDGALLSLARLPDSRFKSALNELMKILDSKTPTEIISRLQFPKHRAELARELGISRSQLLGILYRLEMLQIGTGRNGEEALQLHHLTPLDAAGLSLLTSLSNLRSLPEKELSWFYRALRSFQVKVGMRDLTHWMVTASHRRSQLVLEESTRERELSAEQAEELAYRWYLDSRYWEVLERYRVEEQASGQRQRSSSDEEPEEESPPPEDTPIEFERDESRDDNLICFWISDHAPIGLSGEGSRHAYVCVDPKTGELIPQTIEAGIKRS